MSWRHPAGTLIACLIGAHFSVTAVCAQNVAQGVQTKVRCELLGLGALETVPFNFPGADASAIALVREGSPFVLESSLPAGGNADLARVFAGDMGWPFEHQDLVYFIFDDALFPPDSARTPCTPGEPACARASLHDDVLATAAGISASGCIELQIERAPGSSEFLPITVDGDAAAGGRQTGVGVVVGPGFSSGKFLFMLAPEPRAYCATDADCVAPSGVDGDVCVLGTSQSASGICHFGPCKAGLPCATRPTSSTLTVRTGESSFVTPRVGEHIQSEAVTRAYRGHFAATTFQSRVDPASGDGVVWAIGRDSYWGAPGLLMNPYLMYQPVSAGILGEPAFFTGLDAGEPRFSAEQRDAVPIYQEEKLLPEHSSLAFVPQGDGGIWLMIYGGHSQVNLRNTVEALISPVADELFYDRVGGIYLRWATQPWGPWSDAITIWSPYASGQGGYCEYMYFDDPEGISGYACPDELVSHNAKLNRWTGAGMAGEYGAAIVPRLANVVDSKLSFSWLLSTWNPYRVLMLSTDLELPQP